MYKVYEYDGEQIEYTEEEWEEIKEKYPEIMIDSYEFNHNNVVCKRQVFFHKFWQLIFHKNRQLIFHTYLVFVTHGFLRGIDFITMIY